MKTFKRNIAAAALVTLFRISTLCSPSVLAQDAASFPATNAQQNSATTVFTNNLNQFIAQVTNDKAVCKLLAKHEITLAYHIPDQNIRCYIGFINGKVQAAYGQPTKSDLVFVSSSETLDRLFRGEDCADEMDITVELNLVRKLALKRDIKSLRAAMSRVYLNTSAEQLSTSGLIAHGSGH